MKKLRYIIILASVCFGLASCDYLDVSPDMGIQEDDIFTSYKNTRLYFDQVYYRYYNSDSRRNLVTLMPLYQDFTDLRYNLWTAFTDAADPGRPVGLSFKRGQMSASFMGYYTTTMTRLPIFKVSFELIRVCNKTLANIDRMLDAPTEEDRLDIIGQAYFVRAYAYYTLVYLFGGMPYMYKELGPDDEWDMARLSGYETLMCCAGDFEKAYEYLLKAGKMRRDPFPGESGHLNATDMYTPNGCAAKAMQARCLLYAASDLYNTDHNSQAWVDAAKVAAEAIECSIEYRYEMLPFDEWKGNFVGVRYTNEEIWGWSRGQLKQNNADFSALLAYPQTGYSKASGTCPTQNYVDKFETKWGDPLNTEEDRAKAIAKGHYNDQDPYSNRDPRFDMTVIHDGSVVSGTKGLPINIYYDPKTKKYPVTTVSNKKNQTFGIEWGSDQGTKGCSNTGYYLNKIWSGEHGTVTTKYYTVDPLVRVAELYLNYAEAVNEAYGPNGKAGNVDLTAVEAVDKVRDRAGMPPVLSEYTGDKESFRERIRNERCVELAYEGHHYYKDSRRWKTVETDMRKTLYGMYIESCDVSAEHPRGRKYERRPIPDNRQCTWYSYMYTIPLPAAEANKMKNFVNNPSWN